MIKAELGYYLQTNPLGEDSDPIQVPIYGLRAVPKDVCDRQWANYSFGKQNWQVQIRRSSGHYVWINQARHLIFLH